MKNKIQTLGVVFWIIAAADITGNAANIPLLHYAAKPLLLPVLIILLALSAEPVPGKKIILVALFFSWLGDLFLLFESEQSLFFIFGLVCFLSTHILYIIYFMGIRSENISLLKKYPLLILLVFAYGLGLVWLLFPYLGDLKVPVMVYAAVICSMLLYSLHIFIKVNQKAAGFYLVGAVSFVLSDSLLAINKFYLPFTYAGAFIMLTYCTAQYFIVRGFIEQEKK